MQVSGGGMSDLLGAGGASSASGTATASRPVRRDDDPSSAPAFAALLNGAMTPQPQPEPAARPQPDSETAGELAEGTSQETAADGTTTSGQTARPSTAGSLPGVATQPVAAMPAAHEAGLNALRFGRLADASAPITGAPISVAVDEPASIDLAAVETASLPAAQVEDASGTNEGGTDAADIAAESATRTAAGAPPQAQLGAGMDAAPNHTDANDAPATQDTHERRRVDGADDEDRNGTESRDAAATAGSADVSQIARTLDTVPPELRARIERVVERMRTEGGQEADRSEGTSTPSRTAVGEQGRSLGADVAARTHDGQPATGIETPGGWDNGAAFEQIQRLAQESGAAVPDVRDLGGMTLPDGVRVESLSVEPGTMPAPQPAQPTAQTSVQPNAQPAPQQNTLVGQTLLGAQAAQTGTGERDTKLGRITTDSVDAGAADVGGGEPRGNAFLQATHAALAARRGDGQQSDAGDRRGGQRQPQRSTIGAFGSRRNAGSAEAGTAADAASSLSSTLGTGRPGAGFQAVAAELAGPAPLTGALAADRVAQLIETRDAAPALPMSSLTLKLDNMAGGVDRIRIGLRGLEVGASIELGDAAAAERLQSSIGELRSALGRHGLGSDSVQISSAGRAAEQVDAGRLTATAAGASNAGRPSTGQGNGSSSQQQAQQQSRDPREAMRDAARDSGGNSSEKRNRRDAQSSEDGEPESGRRPRRDRR